MSNKPKFTQGEWDTPPPSHIGVYTKLAETEESTVQIASVLLVPYRSELERQANAHLIAAAPDLYAACESLVAAFEYFGNGGVGDHTVDQVNRALAKARGE